LTDPWAVAVIDQAKAAGVKLFVWSGLDSLGDLTDGRYPVPFFDSKAVITKYLEDSGLPHSIVQSGFYFTNLMVSPRGWRFNADN
jgi:uncharacterized protein YbjT (DUF2867 family)